VKRVFVALFIVMMVLAVAVAAAAGSAMWGGFPFDGSLVIDDETIHFGGGGGDGVLLGLGLPALLAAGVLCLGLLVAGAAVVVLLSPLLIVVAVVWWAVRQNRKLPKVQPLSTPPSTAPPPSMTMTP
jgi:hypothetical protein